MIRTHEEGLVTYFLIRVYYSSWVTDEDWSHIWKSSFELEGRKNMHLNERFVSNNTELRAFFSQSFAKVSAAFFFFASHVKRGKAIKPDTRFKCIMTRFPGYSQFY